MESAWFGVNFQYYESNRTALESSNQSELFRYIYILLRTASVTNQFKTKSHSVDELRDIIVALMMSKCAMLLLSSPKTISRSVDELRDC